MNAVFTVVAKNYLPQARTLGESVRQHHPDLAFHVILADEGEGLLDLDHEEWRVIEAKDIGIPTFREMAFKYDLVEFCTAIKPHSFAYLFERYGYEKIIYLDPDIYVYSALDVVFDLLCDHFAVLTPHLTQLDTDDVGTKPEDDYLRCGVFNLGFMALNDSSKAKAMLSWWRARTQSRGYADFADGLYVDQKWADLMPCFDDDGVFIARNPGLNVAHWNMHQRRLSKTQDTYWVDGQPLVFFHFSGFDWRKPAAITRPHGKGPVTLDGRPEYQALYSAYRDRLLSNNADSAVDSYAYSKFANGVTVYSYQRRLYRALIEQGLVFDDPFSTDPQSYYAVLRRNRMLIVYRNSHGEFRKSDISNAGRKLGLVKRGMLLMKKIMGIKYYHILLRTLSVLSRPEEQIFLLESLHLDPPVRFR